MRIRRTYSGKKKKAEHNTGCHAEAPQQHPSID